MTTRELSDARAQPDATPSPGTSVELALWRIDGATQRSLRQLGPHVNTDLDGILTDFYGFLKRFPETAELIAAEGMVARLICAQRDHWHKLFTDGIDARYVERVQRIGSAHHRVGLKPRFYLSAYSFIMERLVRSVIERNRWSRHAAADQAATLIRTLLMEAELALSVYTHTTTEQHVTDELLDLADTFEQELDDAVQLVRRKAEAMETASTEVLGAARMVSEDGNHVAEASHEADVNAQTIAAATQELSASIAEISRQVDRSTGAAQDATTRSQAARDIANNLTDVSDRIGAIASLIEKIAKETRLLALNASIEAARAGEAGRGFSVVANEVKLLADQTNDATGNIRAEIQSMQKAIGDTVSAIADVAGRVELVNDTITAIASAVVEQDAVTQDIAQTVTQTADSVRRVHERIGSVATQAGLTTTVSTQLRKNTTELVEQVVNIEKRVISSLRNSRFAERRRAMRVTVDIKTECRVDGRAVPACVENISSGGAQIRLAAGTAGQNAPVSFDLPGIGDVTARVSSVEGEVLHVHFGDLGPAVRAALTEALDRWHRGDEALIQTVQAAARQISGLFDDTIDEGGIGAAAMFSTAYQPIPGTDPQQYLTAYTDLCDRLLPPIQEEVLQKEARIDFCVVVDRNGYLPTHNRKYSQPQRPGEPAWNAANCRNRRLFDDFTGIAAARSRAPALVQTYRRDMGGGRFLLLKDVSAPILVHGRHWGALRLGCRPT
ncbi:methyl-accepting chemotaxis protein [Skermanella pratensis]|uniref:methyl-accepting chemotaxis protein n=1 Tax=Skermanella pratensis TaxID=2233999 RepID=UPI001300F8D8|nr:protoglobin domain-containing protein [Skermanella pratensis]